LGLLKLFQSPSRMPPAFTFVLIFIALLLWIDQSPNRIPPALTLV